MFPRVLLCPRCLKVHYGNNPETARQSWRRRNNKPDTTRAGNAHLLAELTPLTHWSRYNLAFAQMAMNEGKRRRVETSKGRRSKVEETKSRNGETRTGAEPRMKTDEHA